MLPILRQVRDGELLEFSDDSTPVSETLVNIVMRAPDLYDIIAVLSLTLAVVLALALFWYW